MRLTNYIRLVILSILFIGLGSSTKVETFKGVLDRMEDDDQAVILIESIHKVIVVPKTSLPVGSQINMWFNIEWVDQTYKIVSIDYKSTENNTQKSTHLMDKLRKK